MSATYAEARDLKVFDWVAYLTLLDPTPEQKREAFSNATCWVTCACGNQCDALPRYYDGEPKDRILSKLGFEFADNIGDICDAKSKREREHAQRDAMKTLVAIEQRAARVLNGLE